MALCKWWSFFEEYNFQEVTHLKQSIMIQEIINTIVQLLLFGGIPFIAYVIKNKSYKDFTHNIGIKLPNVKSIVYGIFLSLLLFTSALIIFYSSDEFRSLMNNPNTPIGMIRMLESKIEIVATILIVSIFKTALAEEIFFRGFIAKKLIRRLGFKTGNLLQSVIFGLIHVLLFSQILSNTTYFTYFLIFTIPTLWAYLITIINEKYANGSVIPSWLSHAVINTTAYSLFTLI